ncbi:MAG: pyridoxamine 5'-phosphate oxidase family protein [Ruminiclostridium sp.]
MEEIFNILKENGYGFLATVDNGKPRVRPFGFMFQEEGKLYFCTNSMKDVYKQLIELPYVEYSSTSKDMVTVRITGEIIFSEEMDKKEKVLNASEVVRKLYKAADNPILKVFYIEHGTATIADFSGNPPKIVEF